MGCYIMFLSVFKVFEHVIRSAMFCLAKRGVSSLNKGDVRPVSSHNSNHRTVSFGFMFMPRFALLQTWGEVGEGTPCWDW